MIILTLDISSSEGETKSLKTFFIVDINDFFHCYSHVFNIYSGSDNNFEVTSFPIFNLSPSLLFTQTKRSFSLSIFIYFIPSYRRGTAY